MAESNVFGSGGNWDGGRRSGIILAFRFDVGARSEMTDRGDANSMGSQAVKARVARLVDHLTFQFKFQRGISGNPKAKQIKNRFSPSKSY